jgi:alpha-tubulin suppressor-like RCC1 family protein
MLEEVRRHMKHRGMLVAGCLLGLTLYILLEMDRREIIVAPGVHPGWRRGGASNPDRHPLETSRHTSAPTANRVLPASAANRAKEAGRTQGLPAVRRRAWDRTFLSGLARAGRGSPITFELLDGELASGEIGYLATTNHEVLYVSGTLARPEPGRFFLQKQTRAGVAGEFVGIVELPARARAYRIEPTGAGGAPELVERALDEVVCLHLPVPTARESNHEAAIPPLNPGAFPSVPVPDYQNGISILESLHGATAVIYLDFQGGYTTSWGGIAYAKPAMDRDQIREVFRRVAEDFMPFNINVTTDLKAFQNAVEGSRQRVIITPTDTAAPQEGGIAHFSTFDYTGDWPCWVFVTQNAKACAEACSHEIGHTLGLLTHEGQDGNGPHVEYYTGQGLGETSWAPIMGVGYYRNVSQWCQGEYLYANNTADELATIVSANNNVGYRPDDTGDTLTTSRYLELYSDYTAGAEGVIERTADTDAFQFTTSGGPVWLRADPASIGPNLALAVSLYDSQDALVLSNCPQDTLWAELSNNLPAGTYSFRVTGAGRNDPLTSGFSSYASLGYYSITGFVANARLPDRFEVYEHATNGTTVGTLVVRNGTAHPVAYTIVSGNTSNTFALDNSGLLTVADNQVLDYASLASQTQLRVQSELFVNITDLVDPSMSETNRRVVVAILPVPLLITQQPENLIVTAGNSAVFSVAAIGELGSYDPVQYQWFFNGTAIPGAAMPTLSLNDVQAQVAGSYTVLVTNSLSALTSVVATLTVTPVAPLFTQRPADQDVLAGSSVGLVAASLGTEPITYQWQFNDVDLAGKTDASLSLLDAQPSDAGSYRVLARNSVGVTASSEAHVSVETVLAWGWNAFGQTNVPAGLTNVVEISGGAQHSLALLREGKVVAWGTGTQTNVPDDLADVVSISAGGSHSLALRRDGTIAAWGQNTAGQVDLPTALTNAVAIAAGGSHNLVLNADGTVTAWGSNTNGQCNVPAGLNSVVAVATGANHSLALRADGIVVGWGDNAFGQTDVPTDLTNAVAIAAGERHSLALEADGTLIAWGANSYGQTSLTPRSAPSSTVRFRPVVAISAGAFHNLGLQADGSVVGWGAGKWGPSVFPLLGQAAVPAGLSQIAAVAAGAEHSLVLAGLGAPFITEPPVSRSAVPHSRVIFHAEATGTWPLFFQWQSGGTNLPGATDRVFVLNEATNGGDYRVIASNALGVATSGVARLTLMDQPPSIRVQPAGQIAYLSSALNLQVVADGSRPFSYQWRFNGKDLNGETNATLTIVQLDMSQSGDYSVAVNNAFGVVNSGTAAVKVTQVAAWGDDSAGETDVPDGLVGVVQVAAGDYHSLALKADGTVVAWGASGVGTNVNFGQTIVPADLTNAVAIAAGGHHSLALRADGTVTAWGAGSSTSSASGPYDYGQAMVPPGLSDVVAIAAGENYSLALREDGHVVVWGARGLTNVPTTVRDIVAVAACPNSIMAIGAGGPIIVWGPQLSLPSGSDFVAIAPGIALQEDGTVSTAKESQSPVFSNGQTALELAGSGTQSMARAPDGTVAVLLGNQKSFDLRRLSDAVAIACGQRHSLVALGDGSLQITAQPSNRKVDLGANTLLRVVAAGAPPLSFQWRLNGADLPGATKFWLRLINVQSSDAGAYTVVVSNPSQVLTSQVATVSVRLPPPPVITQQPSSQVVPMGTNILLTVVAYGAPPLSYQWLKNGSNLPGATGSLLAVTASTRHDSGLYAVAVSNPGGTTVSSNAQLMVQVPQRLEPIAWPPQAGFALVSRDADGGLLGPEDLAGFQAQTSTNLLDWMVLTNSLTLTNGGLLLVDPELATSQQRYYRIVEQ